MTGCTIFLTLFRELSPTRSLHQAFIVASAGKYGLGLIVVKRDLGTGYRFATVKTGYPQEIIVGREFSGQAKISNLYKVIAVLHFTAGIFVRETQKEQTGHFLCFGTLFIFAVGHIFVFD